MKISSKSQLTLLGVLGFIVYFTSYLTRASYNTVLVEIASAENIERTLLSFAVTASFIGYGTGQLLSGWLGDRLDPFSLILSGLGVSSCINLLIPFISSPAVLTVIWGINGFFQALIYPPLIKIISSYIEADAFPVLALCVATGGNVGTLALSALSPVIIHASNWKSVFLFTSLFGAAVFVVFFIYSRYIKKKYGKISKAAMPSVFVGGKSSNGESLTRLLWSIGIVFILVSVFLQGFLKDGVSVWMPSYIADTFFMSSEESILSTALFPVISSITIFLITFIKKKLIKNELILGALFFAACAICIFLLLTFCDNYITSVILLTLSIACMNGANYTLLTFIPQRFKGTGKVSTVVGILNATTFLGSALSAFGFAAISKGLGWNITILIWGISATVGVLFTLIPLKAFKKVQ